MKSMNVKDFGSFKLLDSIVTGHFIEVEDKVRDWLKINCRLVRGKTINKDSVDKELFVVSSQLEYEIVVKVAKAFSDEIHKKTRDQLRQEFKREIEKLENDRRQLEQNETSDDGSTSSQ